MLNIYQTDERLPIRFNRWGCFFLSLIEATLLHSHSNNFYDSTDTILKLFQIEREAYDINCIDEELYIKNYNGFCHVVSSVFMCDNVLSYYNERTKYDFSDCSDDFVVIGKWKYNHIHFVLMNGVGNTRDDIVYNSLQNSKTIEYGSMLQSRVFMSKKRKQL